MLRTKIFSQFNIGDWKNRSFVLVIGVLFSESALVVYHNRTLVIIMLN